MFRKSVVGSGRNSGNWYLFADFYDSPMSAVTSEYNNRFDSGIKHGFGRSKSIGNRSGNLGVSHFKFRKTIFAEPLFTLQAPLEQTADTSVFRHHQHSLHSTSPHGGQNTHHNICTIRNL